MCTPAYFGYFDARRIGIVLAEAQIAALQT
jgi:hypothetical protein